MSETKTRDFPIIFSAPMIRALLDGRKTQTRRLAWILPKQNGARSVGESIDRGGFAKPTSWQKVEPGDRLWVREAFNTFGGGDPGVLVWAADWRENAKARRLENIPDQEPKWRPSIHMPRWASRITLGVTAVRRQRLQEISREDAIAEGLRLASAVIEQFFRWPEPHHQRMWLSPVVAYAWLWDLLHGDGAWDDNPEVVALTFTVAKRNIDAKETAA